MRNPNYSSPKSRLREMYEEANLVTQITLERNRLSFLKRCLEFKRPPQSLRLRGLSALPDPEALKLIQEAETKALLTAIDSKNDLIIDLELKLGRDAPPDNTLNTNLIRTNQDKLNKKLKFYSSCDETKFSHWPYKKEKTPSVAAVSSWQKLKQSLLQAWSSQTVSRKNKRKLRSKRRKMVKKEAALRARAAFALENNLVRNLTGVDVPEYSIAVLSYGAGWIPTPSFNQNQFHLDAVNTANKQCWAAVFKDSPVDSVPVLPAALLKKSFTSPCTSATDPVINQGATVIKNFGENLVPQPCPSNMNRFEREGLNWLREATKSGSIAISQADKGGCILIVTPELVLLSTSGKLADPSRYKPLGATDPLPGLRSQLINKWKSAINNKYVSVTEAKGTVGLIHNPENKRSADGFTISTSDWFKPGIPYPYPLFKIHKLTSEELEQPGIEPPVRLITDLHDGVTARSDKFLVWKWLSALAKDYATDLVKDTSEFLTFLGDLESKSSVSDDFIAFSLDVVSLYDTLKLELVQEALEDAYNTCRPDWSPIFKNWLTDIIIFSFKSAVVKFQDSWFGVADGVPTGGVPSVDCANIAVFFVLKRIFSFQPQLRAYLIVFRRFVDDGCGLFDGSPSDFITWFEVVRTVSVEQFGLDLTRNHGPVTSFSQFLDVRFKYNNGSLTTDIHKKETDANRYLFYSSAHPPHTFRSIVFSQALRYRRIINDDVILFQRLKELESNFLNSGYPKQLVESTIDPVSRSVTSLEPRNKADTPRKFVTPWLMTYGPGYDETRKTAGEVNEMLKLSDTWRSSPIPKILQVVTRRAPNLKDLIFRRKALALNGVVGDDMMIPCGMGRCQTCLLVEDSGPLKFTGKTFQTTGGSCKSSSIIYCMQRKLCSIVYVGKTTDRLNIRINGHRSKLYGKTTDLLNIRINGHRSKFYDILKHQIINPEDDEQILGAHLVQHHDLINKSDFNTSYKAYILVNASPARLRPLEQSYINKLNSIRPFGLNQNNSIV